MKILIVSDTHGNEENLKTVIEKEKPFDLFLHAGDVCGGEERIAGMVPAEIHMVRGNCDYACNLKMEDVFRKENLKFILLHGHPFLGGGDVLNLFYAGKAKGCDVVVFGHTHQPLIVKEDGVILMNPGSLSRPRQAGYAPSYIVVDVENGVIEPKIHFLEKK